LSTARTDTASTTAAASVRKTSGRFICDRGETVVMIARIGPRRPSADLCARARTILSSRVTRSARSAEDVRQRVVPFVAGVLVDVPRRAGHRQFAFPRVREGSGIVDVELIEQRVAIEQTNTL